MSADDELWSSDVLVREKAASRFTVFADGSDPPPAWEEHWNKVMNGRGADEGLAWPEQLAQATSESRWPPYAFGTANASVLVLWHRPGQLKGETRTPDRPLWIDPRTPTLGGVAHAHVASFTSVVPSRSWLLLVEYLRRGLRGFGLRDPLSAVMVACVNPEHGRTGESDAEANRRGLRPNGPIDHVVAVTRPLLVLACGSPVKDAVHRRGWRPASGILQEVDHPTAWEGYGQGRYHGRDVLVPLLEGWARTGRIETVSTG